MIKLPVQNLVQGMVLARSIIEPEQGRVLLTAGQVLTEHYIKRIKELEILYVYIQDELGIDSNPTPVSDYTIIKATQSLQESCQNCIKTGKLQLKSIKSELENIIHELMSQPSLMLGMSDIKNYDAYTYQHSVNVSILALILGIKHEYNHDQLFELGIGAMLHDIGKLSIPQEILNKPGQLDSSEREFIINHPWNGFTLIKKSQQASLLSAHIALQHHERLDGKGYPRRISGSAIHEYAQITAVADIFDAIVSDRPYRPGFTNNEAIKILHEEAGGHVNPSIVEMLVEHIVPYPPGTVLLLSTGDTAIVMKQNKDAYRPVVRLLLDNNGTSYNTDHLVDLLNYDTIFIRQVYKGPQTTEVLSRYFKT